MIISVEEFKKYSNISMNNEVLEAKLLALESAIRKYTNNNFQQKNIIFKCQSMAQKLYLTTPFLQVGDTIQITQSIYNDGLYTIKAIDGKFIELNEPIYDEVGFYVSKIKYPMDVKMGVIKMLEWEEEHGDKIGVQSETISRHSVTYFNLDGDNAALGFPKSLIGFLRPYMKARF